MKLYYIETKNYVRFFDLKENFELKIKNKKMIESFVKKCKRSDHELINIMTGEKLKNEWRRMFR